MTAPLVVTPLLGWPEVTEGADLAALLAPTLAGMPTPIAIVLSSKVLSKSLGLRAPAADKDAVIAAETTRVVAERATGGRVTRIVAAAAGPVMAAAGVDASNVGGEDVVLVLPRDADALAAQIRQDVLGLLARPATDALGVVVSDTAGRPWRGGVTDFALGSAGIRPLIDHRGELDADGRQLSVTVRCPVDELAAAADLVKGKASGIPAALVTGLPASWFDADAAGAGTVVRTGPGDWFALGHVEAVRAALGVPPGTERSSTIGIPSVGALDHWSARAHRVLGLALDDPEVAIDVEHRDTCVDLALSGPDRAVGRILGRLEVAAWAESLAISLAPATVRLSDAGAADSARGSAASSADPVADASLPRP